MSAITSLCDRDHKFCLPENALRPRKGYSESILRLGITERNGAENQKPETDLRVIGKDVLLEIPSGLL
jgi:hypothetical protein